MIRRSLFIIFWIVIVVVLLLFSLVFKDTNTAIVAQVEPMKKAISYHKAVRIEEIYVIPGQMVKPGDILVKVERPDLVLDVEKKNNDIERIKIERVLTESKYSGRQQTLRIEKDNRIRKINSEIEQMEMMEANNQLLSSQFGNLTGYTDTTSQHGKSYNEIELDQLHREKESVQAQYERELLVAKQIYDEEMKSLSILEDQLTKELSVLLEEESGQIKVAEIHGTIGSVNAQSGELLSPYSTILSIYESNPSVIKAIMNEGYHYKVQVGQMVLVESSNRDYRIEGKIIEVGARIIEYPNRLKTNQNITMWGQELFIKIPEENNFLNGERVFVTMKQ